MIEVSVLIDKLNGMTDQEIADYFTQEQVQGEIGDDMSCAIANWVRINSEQWIQVTGEGVSLIESQGWFKFAEGPISFVSNFDKGLYPELVWEHEDYE